MSDNDIDAEALADRVADEVSGIWSGFAEAYTAEDRDAENPLWDRPGVVQYRKVVLASTIARVTLGVAETRLVELVPVDRLEAVRDRIELAVAIATDLADPDAIVREAESLRTRLRVWVKAALTYDPRGTGDDYTIAPGDLGRAMARDFAVMVVFAARDRYVALIQDRAALASEAGKAWAAIEITERWAAHWTHTQRYLSERALSPAVAVAAYRALTDVTRAEFAAIADSSSARRSRAGSRTMCCPRSTGTWTPRRSPVSPSRSGGSWPARWRGVDQPRRERGCVDRAIIRQAVHGGRRATVD
jgi:hypothetical protein